MRRVPLGLRDQFAGLAMSGWLASFGPASGHPVYDENRVRVLAKEAYGVADAMLEARKS